MCGTMLYVAPALQVPVRIYVAGEDVLQVLAAVHLLHYQEDFSGCLLADPKHTEWLTFLMLY